MRYKIAATIPLSPDSDASGQEADASIGAGDVLKCISVTTIERLPGVSSIGCALDDKAASEGIIEGGGAISIANGKTGADTGTGYAIQAPAIEALLCLPGLASISGVDDVLIAYIAGGDSKTDICAGTSYALETGTILVSPASPGTSAIGALEYLISTNGKARVDIGAGYVQK